jgi:hypothetical protein
MSAKCIECGASYGASGVCHECELRKDVKKYYDQSDRRLTRIFDQQKVIRELHSAIRDAYTIFKWMRKEEYAVGMFGDNWADSVDEWTQKKEEVLDELI